MPNQIITVSGNAGSGKTILSYFLADTLIQHKKRAALVCTDDLQPGYPLLFPLQEPKGASLGKLLSLASIGRAELFDQAELAGNNLLVYGYADGESARNYPEIVERSLQSFFHELCQIVDFIVVDTTPARNAIDRFALQYSHLEDVCILTADLRGLAWLERQKPQGKLLLRQCSPYNAPGEIQSTVKERAQTLPSLRVLSAVYNGQDISDLPVSREFRKVLYRLAGDWL